MKFNSQICTTRSQSERLLALGLKPETADMSSDGWNYPVVSWGIEWSKKVIESGRLPAWSLHRLLSLLPQSVKIGKNYYDLAIIQNEFVRLIDEIGDTYIYFDRDGIYESLLLCIEWLIKEGYFPKEYLV